jgi:hypothetical protein
VSLPRGFMIDAVGFPERPKEKEAAIREIEALIDRR